LQLFIKENDVINRTNAPHPQRSSEGYQKKLYFIYLPIIYLFVYLFYLLQLAPPTLYQSLSLLHYFHEIFRQQSRSAAARSLHLTIQTVLDRSFVLHTLEQPVHFTFPVTLLFAVRLTLLHTIGKNAMYSRLTGLMEGAGMHGLSGLNILCIIHSFSGFSQSFQTDSRIAL
jgi:hypothetical protein